MADSMMIKFAIGASLAGTFVSAFTAAKNQIKGLSDSSNGLAKKQALLSQKMAAVNMTQAAVSQAYKQGTISAKVYNNAIEKLGNSMSNLKEQQAAVKQQRYNAHGAKASAAMGTAVKSAAVGYTSMKPIQEAVQFESVMADVRKVVDFDTPEQFKEMGNDILDLSKRLPISAEGIAQIVAAGGQSGIAREDLMAFAESAAKMGVAFGVTADQAGDMMAKWRTAFKMNQGDVVDLADKINYLGNTTAASASLISDVVTRIGPLGEVGGIASGEIAALGASMVGSGVQSEVAATGIKNLILGMTAGEGATKSQAAAFAALGLSATDMAGKMQTDAKGAIIEVLQAIKGLDKEKQAAVLSDLFGKESIGAIAPLLSNLDGLKANFNKVSDKALYAGSMQKEFEAQTVTTANQLILLKNAVTATATSIGSALLPSITPILQRVSQLAIGFSTWASENQELVGSILAAALGMASGVTVVSGALAGYHKCYQGFMGAQKLIGSVQKGFSKALPAIRSFSSFLGKGLLQSLKLAATGFKLLTSAVRTATAFLMTNPILLAIMAIAVAAYLIISNWDTVSAYLIGFWNTIQPYWAAFTSWLMEIWNTVTAAVISAWDTVSGAVGNVITAIVSLMGAAASWCMSLWNSVSDFLSSVWDSAVNAVSGFVNSIYDLIGSAVQWCIDKWNSLKEIFSSPIQAVVNFVKSGSSDAIGAAGKPIPENAEGGIYARGAFLTSFAERSPEAAIPINGSARAARLWTQTGQMMGLLPKSVEDTEKREIPVADRVEPVNKLWSRASQMIGLFPKAVEDTEEREIPIADRVEPVDKLWSRASQMIGLFPKAVEDTEERSKGALLANVTRLGSIHNTLGETSITLSYNPQITIMGNTGVDKVRDVMDDQREKLKEMLEKITRDRRRLAFD